MLIRFGDQPQLSSLSLLCNTADSGLFSNVAVNSGRGLPEVRVGKPTKQPAVLVGGGPSLAATLESIRELKDSGAYIFALNNTAKFLAQHGIRPHAQILVDPRPQNASFLEQSWADEVFLASQCDPALFDHCKAIGYPVTMWHAATDGVERHIVTPDPCRIGGGLTVGLAGACVAHTLGHRELHLFGYDSSHAAGASHAYEQAMNLADEMARVTVDSQTFDCSLAMAAQADEFRNVSQFLMDSGTAIHVYGDGLLPTLWRLWEREKNQRVLSAVYDLGVLAPGYEFREFLVCAEEERVAGKFDYLDIVFQPGPMHGFRADAFKEDSSDIEQKKQMLWQVCVGMARRHKSVRNIEVLGQRRAVAGEVFPSGWEENKPKSHYQAIAPEEPQPLEKTS